ncbi:ATP-grasp domain-containing protein [[Clostridium] polysaccharolyticum]|uniref:ATP-grasp domain-containing protein n=1 Tax=[Clostridium] polysaccharolyticum TaxID=29364 RepID=UPI001FA8395B|nr:RimK family alpha-L-glutamate ligase [[Clostridium] polysaccharolyticum]
MEGISDGMKGYLVVNHFLRTEKFEELYQWFVEAGQRIGIQVIIKTNVELMTCLGTGAVKEPEVSFVLFWDKDIKLAKVLEGRGYRVFNSSDAIAACDDKALTHIALEKAQVPMPRTWFSPMTYENIGYPDAGFLERIEECLGYPMVVKECFGSFGQQVYLCHNREEAVKHMGRNVIFQEYISSSFGRDIRLQVVGEQVVAGMYRYSENGDFRANISNGGKMKPYTWTAKQEALAIKSVKAIGLDFAGVDILFGKQEEPMVCEVNSNAHFKNIFDCTGVNTADFIMEYIKKMV